MDVASRQFFVFDGSPATPVRGYLPENCLLETWRPGRWLALPPGSRFPHAVMWWLLHATHLFYNRDWAVLLVRRGGDIVRSSYVFPGYVRFPFMAVEDVQVGAVWTAPEVRGKGLATFVVQHALREFAKPGRRFWYIAGTDNHASARVAQKAGFRLYGYGNKTSHFGIRWPGSYRIDSVV